MNRSAALRFTVAAGAALAFLWIGLARIPGDGLLRYDEATHVFEGIEVRDAARNGGANALAEVFLEHKVMKGILYRLWFAAAAAVQAPGTDGARRAALVACAAGILALYFLARRLARPGQGDDAGMLAVVFAAAAPLLHTWGRTAMVEPLNFLTVALALAALVRDRQVRSPGSAAVAVSALLLAVFTKYNHALILCAAAGLDAILAVALDRSSPSLRARLRPLLPLALLLPFLCLWFADAERARGFWYYIVTVPGSDDPVSATGSTYAGVLLQRLSSWSGGTALLALCLACGVRGATRLPLLHVAIGLALAQLNVLKLERILVPLLPSLFAVLGAGGAALAGLLRARARLGSAAPFLLAGLVALPGWRALALVEPAPLRTLDAVLDASLDLIQSGAPRQRGVLVIGQAFYAGQNRLSLPHFAIRAHERGAPVQPGAIALAGEEFLRRNGLPESALRSGGLDGAAALRLLEPFDALILLQDQPDALRPFVDPVAARLAKLAAEGGRFESVAERRVELPDLGGATRLVLLRRNGR